MYFFHWIVHLDRIVLSRSTSRQVPPFGELGVVDRPEGAEVVLEADEALVQRQVGPDRVLPIRKKTRFKRVSFALGRVAARPKATQSQFWVLRTTDRISARWDCFRFKKILSVQDQYRSKIQEVEFDPNRRHYLGWTVEFLTRVSLQHYWHCRNVFTFFFIPVFLRFFQCSAHPEKWSHF